MKNNSYLKEYESVSDEIKYISNSLMRLKILETLYECPLNMKEINNTTGLSYSSISSNIHGLETEGHVYREINNYYLSNCAKLQMKNILEFNMVIKLLNKFFTILDNHIVDIIPSKSITEIFSWDCSSRRWTWTCSLSNSNWSSNIWNGRVCAPRSCSCFIYYIEEFSVALGRFTATF